TNKPRLIRIISRPIFGRMFYGIYCQSRKSLDNKQVSVVIGLPAILISLHDKHQAKTFMWPN
ncbi:hypothetical protein EFO55_13275, partial [Lacticaseibacillus rhamnosus]|nr:hypothetical protein [Lacticaseibacillus rhamnosus]